jgi:transposase-like protein
MVALVYSCPHCGQSEPVVRFGKNASGTQRLWCKDCKKAFTPAPSERRVTPEKEAQITAALSEKLSQRAIARMLKVSRDTVRSTLKKSAAGSTEPEHRRANQE